MDYKNIFLDTNILVDFLIDRKEFVDNAKRLIEGGKQKKFNIYISALSFANAYYILRKYDSPIGLMAKFQKILPYIKITPSNEKHIKSALVSNFSDFEDALQYFSAMEISNLDAIITRNKKHFKVKDIAILTPEEFLSIQI